MSFVPALERTWQALWRSLGGTGDAQWSQGTPLVVLDGKDGRWQPFYHAEATAAGPQAQATALATSGDQLNTREGVYRIIASAFAATATVYTRLWLEVLQENDQVLFRIFRVIGAQASSALWDYTLFLPRGFEIVMRTDATLAGEDMHVALTLLQLMAD